MPDDPAKLARRLLELSLDQIASHALILLDPGGVIVGWLAGAERMFGYRAEEVIGKNVVELFVPEDVEKRLSHTEIITARDSGESEDDRWQLRKDGGRFWASGTLTALRDEHGELLGFAKTVRNRTDQKSQVDTLESRVSLLQQSTQQKNNFISILAHELRNPLSAIANAAELLGPPEPRNPEPGNPEPGNPTPHDSRDSPGSVGAADSQASPDAAGQDADLAFVAGVVRRQVDFMSRLIGDLLDVTRAAAGKLALNPRPLVLQEIVHLAIEASRSAVDSRGHTLHPLMPEVPIQLNGDAMRLRQVFVNLIENAAKYTPPGGTIWVKATAENLEAVVRVQDTGIGIAPEIMPHLFELFTQAEGTTQQQHGLGIGLSVVHDTITQHGGSVQATSDGLGKGSEFTVRLPLLEKSA